MTRIAAILTILAAAGCSGERSMRCDTDELYRGAETVAPIRVPDDLSVPDESEALRLPSRSMSSSSERPPGECLESPPDFFEADPPA